MAGSMSGDFRDTVRRHLKTRWRLFAALSVLLVGLLAWDLEDVAAADDVPSALAAALEARGVELDPSSLLWLDRHRSDLAEEGGRPLLMRPVMFIGAPRGGSAEVYFAQVRAGGGAVLDVHLLSNLTRTSGADETHLVRSGARVAYLSRVGDGVTAVSVLDLRGEPASLTEGWPARARLQNQVTNLQTDGRAAGFGRIRYALRPAGESVELSAGEAPGDFDLTLDGAQVRLVDGEVEPEGGDERVEARAAEKGQPGTITWVVDTVRGLSFVGPEPIAWLEHRVFGVRDAFQRMMFAVVGDDDEDGEAEAANEMGFSAPARRRAELSVTDPELGWPPAPLESRVRRRGRGSDRSLEGQWQAIVDDPFVRSYPNAPPAFYTTHVRVDPDRPYARVYVVVWDPRQLQLRVMTGTREPESATGETGPGLIPRDDETMSRVVAGFNGGFQSLHGEFGMMSEGRVYLPPKPWGATVAVMADGRTMMGSWLDPPEGERRFREEWAVAQIPDGMVEMRQNLTSVVEGDRYNPWRRWWWGAAPANDGQQVYIHRSGMCLTREGFMAYFWGKAMSSDALGEAMLTARCVRGLHLDMNNRHTAFELYNVRPASEPFPDLGRNLDREFEFAIDVPSTEHRFHMRGRKLVRSMTPMRFPRYIRRDPRDFFYLTIRPTLPGPHVAFGEGGAPASGTEGEGQFSTSGLPHAGYPHAFARTFLGGADDARTWVVRIDARRAPPAPVAGADVTEAEAAGPLAYLTGANAMRRGAVALYAAPRAEGQIGERYHVGAPPADARVVLRGEALTAGSSAEAAIGVDGDGFIVYAERRSGDSASLSERLAQVGVTTSVALPAAARLAFVIDEQTVAPDAFERLVEPAGAIAFIADTRPETEVLFPDVRPRPYMQWGRMQDTRVRYRYDADRVRRFSRTGGDMAADE